MLAAAVQLLFQSRAEVLSAVHDGCHGVNHLCKVGRLEHYGVDAFVQHSPEQPYFLMNGVYYYAGVGMCRAYYVNQFEAVDVGHADVDDV